MEYHKKARNIKKKHPGCMGIYFSIMNKNLPAHDTPISLQVPVNQRLYPNRFNGNDEAFVREIKGQIKPASAIM